MSKPSESVPPQAPLEKMDAEWEEAGQLWAKIVQRVGNEGQAAVILARMYLDVEREANDREKGEVSRVKVNGF